MNYKFSCLIPIYDNITVKDIENCLDSIYKQTVKPNEIVIVIDGFIRDELMKTLDKYNVKTYQFEKQPLANILNYGIEKCKYNLIARMDIDDVCLPDRFEKEILEFRKNKKLALVGGQILEFDQEHKKRRIVPFSRKDISKFAKFRNPFNHMTVIFKKNVILKYGGYENIHQFEDYYLWIKLLDNNVELKNIKDVVVLAKSDKEHIKRRGSFNYIKKMYHFEKTIYQNGFINFFEFVFNIIIRSIVCILPNVVREKIYYLFLRK